MVGGEEMPSDSISGQLSCKTSLGGGRGVGGGGGEMPSDPNKRSFAKTSPPPAKILYPDSYTSRINTGIFARGCKQTLQYRWCVKRTL